jgi:hypothetical protein
MFARFAFHRPLSALLVAGALAACSGADRAPTSPTPPAPSVFLKDVVELRLPSPYYHFTYDPSGRVATASFAGGIRAYGVAYDGDRIAELRNDAVGNRDRLAYAYDDAGRVGTVSYVDETGAVFARVRLAYADGRLAGLERERLLDGAFAVERSMAFSYYPDGNLLEIADRHPAIAGRQDETNAVLHFDGYDDGINVDAFELIHDEFFDHLVLLPAVQLQKGNPARVTRTGDGVNYVEELAYTYDAAKRPREKNGVLTYTNGPDAGRQFATQSLFTYY